MADDDDKKKEAKLKMLRQFRLTMAAPEDADVGAERLAPGDTRELYDPKTNTWEHSPEGAAFREKYWDADGRPRGGSQVPIPPGKEANYAKAGQWVPLRKFSDEEFNGPEPLSYFKWLLEKNDLPAPEQPASDRLSPSKPHGIRNWEEERQYPIQNVHPYIEHDHAEPQLDRPSFQKGPKTEKDREHDEDEAEWFKFNQYS